MGHHGLDIPVKRTTVLWLNHRDKVWTEIASLLGVLKVDAQTPGWFPQYSKAIGNIIGRMTAEELILLDCEVAVMAAQGFPEEKRIKYMCATISLPLY